jgi:hypothetical protein
MVRHAEEEAHHARRRLVGHHQVPQAVDHDGRIRRGLGQHEVERLLHCRHFGVGQVALAVGRREACRQQHGIALAERNIEHDAQLDDQVAPRLRAARLQEAQVALRDAAIRRQAQLAHTTLAAPVAQGGGEVAEVLGGWVDSGIHACSWSRCYFVDCRRSRR